MAEPAEYYDFNVIDYILMFYQLIQFIIGFNSPIGGVRRKNNGDETVGVFIGEKVWLENSLSQLGGGGTRRGHVQVEKQAVEGKDPKCRPEHRGADKSLAQPRRKQARATEDFDVHISYLYS